MIKFIICIFIISGCSAAGLIKASAFGARTKELENILEVIKLLQIEIGYRKEPLQKIFSKLYSIKSCWFTEVLNVCSINLTNTTNLNEAWHNALNCKMNVCPLEKEDIVILEDLSLGLGKSDTEGQLNLIKPAIERLDGSLKDSQDKEIKLGRMYRGLGISMGIVIVILFI